MSKYEVKDYGIFNEAVSSTKTFGNSISTLQSAVNDAKSKLGGGIFEGPISENCMAVFGTLNTDIESMAANYDTISSYITSTSNNYQGGDQAANQTIQEDTSKTNTITSTNFATQAKVTNTRMSIPKNPVVAAKKQQWLGDVDDKSKYTYYQGDNLYSRTNHLEVFDNTTGEVFSDGGVVNMKPGETRVLTVKLPTDTGMINQITRTTADGNAGYRSGKVVTARSDIDPDPNKIEWVRMVEGGNHKPSDMSLLHNNSYDWVITATGEGTVTASQTCLWSSDMTKGRNLKGMVDIKVNVKS